MTSGVKDINKTTRMTFAELAKSSGRSIESIKADVKSLAEEYQKNGDSIPLSYKKAYAKIGVYSESAEKKMKKSSEEIGDSHKKESEKAANSWKTAFSIMEKTASAGVKVFVTGAKVAAMGIGAAATGVAALGTAAVKSYADYEQLVGGIETLFGAGGDSVQEYADKVGKSVSAVQDEYNALMEAQSLVLDNANKAYKTAGLSANEYMETVTSFSAALISSLNGDTEAAANAADIAITDMSDNANKMGTSMELIQNAYQGFAKQNYTMLDNLKLGYGGTKEEMQRLLADAEKLTGIKYDISNLSDVYSAIHVIQTELGITGTTAKEASTTITGSLNSMKAAWANLVVGIADDTQDFDTLVNNFVESAVTAADNLLPRIETTLGGIGELVEKLLPVIMERVPSIMSDILPDLVKSGTDMILSIAKGLKENLPQLMESGREILSILVGGIVQMLPTLGSIAYDIVMNLLSGITDNADSVLNGGSELLVQLTQGLRDTIPDLLSAGVEAVLSLAMALTEPDTLSNIIDAGIDLFMALFDGLLDAIPRVLEAAPTLIGRLVAAIIANVPKLTAASVQILLKLASSMVANTIHLIAAVPKLYKSLIDSFKSQDWGSIGKDMVDGVLNGLKVAWDWLVDTALGLAKGLWDSIVGLFKGEADAEEAKARAKASASSNSASSSQTLSRNVSASMSTMQMNTIGASASFGGNGFGNFNQTINVNQPVSTPDEFARAVRVESRYGLMRGVPVVQNS
ncbi:MAG: hypothetical protein ACI4DR_01775 [Roseburia sp.]